MPKVRVHMFSMSFDGFGAGPDQCLEHPLGVRGEELHGWAVATRAFRELAKMGPGGDEGVDNHFVEIGDDGIGATIMGRNMFGPTRGEWGDDEWKGWWGPNPPYHHPVFVLTNHPRDPIPMEGGTTFNFVTGGIEEALGLATAAAGTKDIRLGGGVSTVQQFLRAGLIDDLHVAMVPVLLGRGERLFDNLDGAPEYECVEHVSSPNATHVRFAKKAA